MEQSRALQGLNDAADVVKFIEETLAIGSVERMSAASISGMQVMLRSVRDSIMSSHDVLANDFVARAKGSADGQRLDTPRLNRQIEVEGAIATEEGGNNQRRDLRSALDKAREQNSTQR